MLANFVIVCSDVHDKALDSYGGYPVQVKACRPLGNGVRASAEMNAMPDRLRLITPGGIPAPPEAASQLLADVGVSRDDLRYRVGSSITVMERSDPADAGRGQGLGHEASQQTPSAAVQEPLRAGGRALNPAQLRGPHAPVTLLEALAPSPLNGSGESAAAAAGLSPTDDQPRTPSRPRRQSGDLVRCLLACLPDAMYMSFAPTNRPESCSVALLRPCLA